MSTGSACGIITPDGSHGIPDELWAEYAAIVLLEPEPALLDVWVRRIEDSLGVTDELRARLERRAENRRIRPWSILRVNPGMERKVAAALGPRSEENPHGAGLTVHVPLERYRPANSWRARNKPLIPGCIFAWITCDYELDVARRHDAVKGIVCRDGRPVRVEANMMGALILAEAFKAFDRTWDAPPPPKKGNRPTKHEWEKGELARVIGGPFAGFNATVESADRADRMEVFVTMFGRVTPVELDEEMLIPLA
jgi:transcription antitermination factor NusG